MKNGSATHLSKTNDFGGRLALLACSASIGGLATFNLAGCGGAIDEPGALGTASSALTEAEDPEVDAKAVAYYVGKYHVTEAEASRRLALQDQAMGLDDDLIRLMGADYGGIWYDAADGGRLKVGITSAAAATLPQAQRIVSSYGVDGQTDWVRIPFSVADLERTQESVRPLVADMIASGHAKTGYNTAQNSVIVTALADLPADEESRLRSIGAVAGVSIRRIGEATLRGRWNTCTVNHCDRPLQGGLQISSNLFTCTSAFTARDHADATHFVYLTAGHCVYFDSLFGANGLGDKWSSKDEASNWHGIGSSWHWWFAGGPGFDASALNVNANSFWASPAPAPKIVPDYKIKKDALSVIGHVLCREGQTTGLECGAVAELNDDESADGPDGLNYTVKHMGELDMCGSAPGDSGGPIFKSHAAYGIFSGMSTGLFSCYEWYQGIRSAEKQLKADILLAP